MSLWDSDTWGLLGSNENGTENCKSDKVKNKEEVGEGFAVSAVNLFMLLWNVTRNGSK